jgi:hypothetical protein
VTISQVASTGITTATAARGTTTNSCAYVGVAAGRMAILTAACKPSTGTFTDPTGWLPITNATGGTGTNAADTGLSRIAKWYRVLDGTESGSVSVVSTGGVTTAVMDVYSGTVGAWGVPVSVVGSDATHGANASAACGAWASATAAGDLIHCGYATDTDDTGAITAPTLTQTSVTFGTVTARSRFGNSDGNDNSVYTWDAIISSGANTNAPTLGLTWAASSCGAVAALRIREATAGTAMSTLTDNFDDNSRDTSKWSGTYGTVAETGAVAHITCDTGFNAYQSGSTYKFDSFYCKLTPPALASATVSCYAQAIVQSPSVASGTDAGFYIDVFANQIYFVSRVGFFDGGATPITYSSTSHKWVRLRISGANLLFDTSADGNTWTNQRTMATPAWLLATQDMDINFETNRNNGTNNFYDVDNFNVAPFTTITKDLDLRWRVSNVVTDDSDLRWAVRSIVTDDADLRWAVKSTITKDLDLRWAVRSTVTDDSDLRWRVSNIVTDTSDLRWRVSNIVTDDSDLRWAVRSTITKDLDLRWTVRSVVTDDADLRWVVRNAVTRDLDLRWRVSNTISDTIDLRWRVSNRVSADSDLRWAVRSTMHDDADVRWAVRSVVTKDPDLRWSVLEPTHADLDARWAVRALVAHDLDVRWRVAALVAKDLDLRWGFQGKVSSDLDVRWITHGIATADSDLRWAVRSVVAADEGLVWAVRSLVTKDLDLRWAVDASASVVNKTLDARWDVRALAARPLDVRWAVRAVVQDDLTLLWLGAGRVSVDVTLRWVVLSDAQPPLPADATYGSEVTATVSLAPLFIVTGAYASDVVTAVL